MPQMDPGDALRQLEWLDAELGRLHAEIASVESKIASLRAAQKRRWLSLPESWRRDLLESGAGEAQFDWVAWILTGSFGPMRRQDRTEPATSDEGGTMLDGAA